MSGRPRLVYGVLIAAWATILVWQVLEHHRVRGVERIALVHRAKDISTTLGLVLHSQRRFGVISQDRIESALSSLIKPGELNGVALLNAVGDVVASAGAPIDFETRGLVSTGEHWGESTVTLMNLVDLGTNLTAEPEGTRPTIVVPRGDMPTAFTNRPPRPPPGQPPELGPAAPPGGDTNAPPRSRGRPRYRGDGDGRPPFGRPFWMSEEEYQAAIQKQGVHRFAIMLSKALLREACARDLWIRIFISVLASVSVVGVALAWSNLSKSAELEVRLARASELNARLKEMNLAAAGLAHETKNPLNIIRGLAQLISRKEDAPPEVRDKSRSIVEETDHVTAQLNEFINYSRPREIRRSTVALNSVVAEVVRALSYDLEEKAIQLEVQNDMPAVEADEQLLRQALFNLLLNSIQAVPARGEIRVAASKTGSQEAFLEVRDNGPGVPPDRRSDVFKPYFTTNEKGTGLGLAVVQQIVLAHSWEIECLDNQPRGAVFRISHLRLAGNGGTLAART